MRLFTIAMMGFVCIGMAVPVLANPSMLPKHPGYPSRGEFANDAGRKSLTYSQSIEEAAKSGDTTMGVAPIDPKSTKLLEPQVVHPLSKEAIEQPVKEDIEILKK